MVTSILAKGISSIKTFQDVILKDFDSEVFPRELQFRIDNDN